MLAWRAALKKTKVGLELLINYLLMAVEGIRVRVGKYHSINRCAKANDEYMKDYIMITIKNYHIVNIRM